MAKIIKYKHEKGALHIGGGRFFYAGETYEVPEEEAKQLTTAYDDLETVEEKKAGRGGGKHADTGEGKAAE
ncbi:hypothetical protein NDK47_17725 [Brevibacillus ruminantium]|uniref:Phage protein n=1 Tax=Brevibacillus ruminantium TaxID=2950604 RepID=A0ABY4WB48_9BACL|nr:hypothetical protein [Brevibacillus ruminantium]USG63989.1 hypothetical protein NDK47_17725 [Brevibacillus ruminantium]